MPIPKSLSGGTFYRGHLSNRDYGTLQSARQVGRSPLDFVQDKLPAAGTATLLGMPQKTKGVDRIRATA
jgi:hypothetical protein